MKAGASITGDRADPADYVYRIGVDIGGTFTDVAFSGPDGILIIEKVLSTPAKPGEAVIAGIRQVAEHVRARGLPWEGAEKYVAHGSTIVSNTLIERKGAVTALVTNEGFRDILEIGREMRFDLFDLQIERPEPLIPRRRRLGIAGRIEADGSCSEPLDEDQVRRLAHSLSEAGVRSFAVCLLHAYRNNHHETRVRALIRDVLGSTVSISISSEVVSEIREYERLSTTVVNAYVQPIVDDYIFDITSQLESLDIPSRRFFVMFSNGGLGAPEVARTHPVRMAESGPAAAAIGAGYFGGLSGPHDLIAFDMGGTTAKACLIHDGVPSTTTEGEIARAYHYRRGSGIPIKTPLIEMIEIGSGGGSLARIDERLGLLAVGPRSAGAAPGPACYDLGGEEPTVTDADLVLGFLDPTFFLGGKMTLSHDAGAAAIRSRVGRLLDLTDLEAAWRIHDLVNENMANSIRVHCVEQGRAPSDYSLVAVGGAGPVHAFNMARKLGISRIVYPTAAGVLSSLGLLIAPVSFDFVRSLVVPLNDAVPVGQVNALFDEMEDEAVTLLTQAGVPPSRIAFERSADIRYRGQGFEIPVDLPVPRLTTKSLPDVTAAFSAAYERRFARTIPGVTPEVINWRLRATGPRLSNPDVRQEPGPDVGVRAGRDVHMAGSTEAWPVFRRSAFRVGDTHHGPALIEENETTIVIGHEARFTVDAAGNLVALLS